MADYKDQYRELWSLAFGDTEKYMDYFFSKKIVQATTWDISIEDRVISMLYALPYSVWYQGENYVLPYIVGVATRPEYRHQGYMRSTMITALRDIWNEEYRRRPIVFLSPADPAIYEPLGFVPVYWRETTIVQGEGERHQTEGRQALHIRKWRDLTMRERILASDFAGDQIRKEEFDLYLGHYEGYYENVNEEMEALDGAVLVLYDGDIPVGVANWIQEDGQQEVTELICIRKRALEVIESLQDWVRGQRLTIDDSMYIDHIEGPGITRKKQDRPYLMIRTNDGFAPPAGLRCYVNDIT